MTVRHDSTDPLPGATSRATPGQRAAAFADLETRVCDLNRLSSLVSATATEEFAATPESGIFEVAEEQGLNLQWLACELQMRVRELVEAFELAHQGRKPQRITHIVAVADHG